MEPGRVELPSKQAIKELSTRLFPDWIFVVARGREQPHNAYLLKFSRRIRSSSILRFILRFSLMERHEPGLSGRIQLLCLAQTWHYLTIIRIMQLKRSYFRRLKVLRHWVTGDVSVPDVLTVQFDPLSKPVGPSSNNNHLSLQI